MKTYLIKKIYWILSKFAWFINHKWHLNLTVLEKKICFQKKNVLHNPLRKESTKWKRETGWSLILIDDVMTFANTHWYLTVTAISTNKLCLDFIIIQGHTLSILRPLSILKVRWTEKYLFSNICNLNFMKFSLWNLRCLFVGWNNSVMQIFRIY